MGAASETAKGGESERVSEYGESGTAIAVPVTKLVAANLAATGSFIY
jgi:hypothetical protein